MLVNCDQDRAVRYVRNNMDRITQSGDLFQLSLLNLLRKMCKTNPQEKGKYLKVISSLLDSKTPSVLYQCAVTLISLSASPIAIRAAANCFTQLLLSVSQIPSSFMSYFSKFTYLFSLYIYIYRMLRIM